ncbi:MULTISPECIES: LD-carboxypeptidase [unclassified Leptolyngbya]|uniref:S66 peptidase family protein n=1 Tax=unclassified Leptolyngbya TaxID=2650499 RepID=UPI0016851997|nr:MULTISPECIES: LD-carboxypeptidase [unclassified Leptolyngbya]MBD1909522.1 LD-carboxypeptidase [Leptolyngbya sp. FACHB-8]MBD2154632.1 LD-carboxypeptidase [Leptolyngbya sp. FACHB-16]
MLRCLPPEPLKAGDLLRVVIPSGAVREVEMFNKGVEIWRSHGFRVEVPHGFDRRWGYLGGKDDERRRQLQEAWDDPACRGVLCARGGYGSMRLLEAWDWGDRPNKWMIGFSDITSLLWSLSLCGVSGVHGPLLTTLAKEPGWSIQRLFDWVEGGSLLPIQGKTWVNGQAEGRLLPANLTVATHLLHTPLQPDLDGVILAIEDVTEAPYRVDRMLTHWRLTGLLKQVKGIAVGRFSQCEPPPNVPSFTVEGVLRDRLEDLGIPVVAELPFGHDGPNAALPVGVPVRIDGDSGKLVFL